MTASAQQTPFRPEHLEPRLVLVGARRLKGLLAVPPRPKGLVIFAHGSGSGRLSPRNNYVAKGLQEAGLATLLLDLLAPEEEANRANVFDIPLLASRLAEAADWAGQAPEFEGLPLGYFGASTGAGAALLAAARADGRIRAIVSRGGRPDLAGAALREVEAPTLLLVGSLDEPVIGLNRQAGALLNCPRELRIVPGAGHLFEEPGTLDIVIREAARWFVDHFDGDDTDLFRLPFADRRAAGRALAARLSHLAGADPLVLALPRGGVPVAAEIAKSLGADLDLLLVRKLGAPGHSEVGIGAVVEGEPPQLVMNEAVLRQVRIPSGYVEAELRRQLAEMERRRRLYVGDRTPTSVAGRTVILVDDGVATGGTIRAALQGLGKTAARVVLAVPVAPRDLLDPLAANCDELVCLASPEPFHAVGAHYRDFGQTSDEEVIALLAEARARRARPLPA